VLPVAAKAIVSLAFLFVFQYIVGFIDFLEFFLGLGVFADIGMILSRQFAVRFFDLCRGSLPGDA